MTEVEQPSQNGIELTTEEDENNKARPADIEQDMREMERRKRVEAIMGSKLFREELERIVDSQIREGGASGILQHLSDIVGVPTARIGNVFKSSNCVLPINDIRGVESMGYSKGEKILRCKLAATFRLLDLFGWTKGIGAQITARLKVDQELFLVNPYGLLSHEVTASSLNKVDMQGNVIEQGTTNFGVNKNQFILHSVVHAARPDIRCAIYIGCNPVVAVSSLKVGLLPLTNNSVVLGEISTHQYTGCLSEAEERERLVRNLGPVSKVMLLTNHGALCCGETIEEAFFAAHHIVQACETQLNLLPMGIDNLVMIPEETRKLIYDAARRPPEDLAAAFEKKASLAAAAAGSEDVSTDKDESQTDNGKDTSHKWLQQPKWRVGGAEFEALMRMLDNAGFRTGYIYRHPLIKSELPRHKNDVEVPPAVSSLGYLLEEEELYRQGIWKKGDWRKGGDRSRWLNSPNVYQKVEVLETGTPDPKKITKWVAEGSPTHSTPVRIEGALQFVPPGTNPKEFKKVQQQIKDNRRADKISAGPQSHILEGVTWDEANRIKDATVSSAGDHVVLMGAASKGIIQRGFQHNATVYKAPYAKNPFDNVTDDELNEYKRTVERKKNIHGEYTDTDFSESEALSSLQTSGAQQQNSSKTAAVSQSETEDASEHQVMRIETKQAPVPSQPEVVLSDATLDFLNGERQHTAAIKSLPSPRAEQYFYTNQSNETYAPTGQTVDQDNHLIMINYERLLLGNSFNPIFPDNCLMSHIDFNQLMQQKTLPKLDYRKLYYDVYPGELETTSAHMFSHMDPNCQPDFNSERNYMLFDDLWSKTSTSRDKNERVEFKPYRTLSHFGFNCPRAQKAPEHFHIPVSPSKYVSVNKSSSYNEIFSSPRYVDACDTCFNKILSLRPKLIYPFNTNCDCQAMKRPFVNLWLSEDNDQNNDIEDDFDLLEDVKNWIDGVQLNASRVLEPVEEADEEDQVCYNPPAIDHNSNVINTVEGSTFFDKITRMNYSEESTNVGFIPSRTVTSDITTDMESNLISELAHEMCDLSLQLTKDNDSEQLCSAEQPFSDDRTVDVNSSSEGVSIQSGSSARKLMSREERNQRKQEFFELWEDHIEYYTPKRMSDSDKESVSSRSEVFFGEIHLSNTTFVKENDAHSLKTDTETISAPSPSEQLVHHSQSVEFHSIVDTEPMESDTELNSMERMIIEKIAVNHLKDQEQIFDDIEKSIRHKMTPSKLEKLVQRQLRESASNVVSSTPEPVSSQQSDSFYSLSVSHVDQESDDSNIGSNNSKNHLRKIPTLKNLSRCEQHADSYSLPSALSSSTDNSSPKSRSLERCVPKKPTKCPKHPLSSESSDSQLSRKRIKRNFVVENILNAAKPCRRYNTAKCLPSNPFVGSVSTPCVNSSNNTPAPSIYSFQTKSVRGSPRFWVTLTPKKKEISPHPKLNAKKIGTRRNGEKNKAQGNPSRKYKSKYTAGLDLDVEMKPTKVDEEIESLGEQISALNPRFERYDNIINEYGKQVANVSQAMDIVAEIQNEIEDSRQKLRDDIILNQYIERISCDVQTFSISETDD